MGLGRDRKILEEPRGFGQILRDFKGDYSGPRIGRYWGMLEDFEGD